MFLLAAVVFALVLSSVRLEGAELRAGAAKIDITNVEAGPVNDRLYARALVISDGHTTTALIALDVVAIGEIGYVTNDYLPTVRARCEQELAISPQNILVNASHCHGVPCTDVAERTLKAVGLAMERMVPVTVGVGTGQENRVMENRRLKLKSGREADVRHAYALPPDDEVAAVGPVDPEIGILRLDDLSGRTVAVVYNFACHPIQGVPGGGNTADMTGFSSQVVEDAFGGDAIALFVQGCAGDINPVRYKDVGGPRDAEPLGHLLGMSVVRAARAVECRTVDALKLISETLTLPRADLAQRIEDLKLERETLLRSLQGTTLNLKTFMPLAVQYHLSEAFPASYSHRYLHEAQIGREDLKKFDAENRRNMEQYIKNIYVMEQLTRVQTNLALLEKHQQQLIDAGKRTIDVEVAGLRLGDFVLITFPGELTVQIGLNIKSSAPRETTFVAGYTNGYIYYAPTAEQLANVGGAQEDSDCILAPEWQALFEAKAAELLARLERE